MDQQQSKAFPNAPLVKAYYAQGSVTLSITDDTFFAFTALPPDDPNSEADRVKRLSTRIMQMRVETQPR